MLGTHVFVLLLVTLLAAHYALTEAVRVEEIARLREKVALGDYRLFLSSGYALLIAQALGCKLDDLYEKRTAIGTRRSREEPIG